VPLRPSRRVRQDAEELADATRQLRRAARGNAGSPWPPNLTSAQLDLLRVVRRRPGVSVGTCAQELGIASNTVSTLIGQLSDAGFIERRADAADRRIARLELTAAARREVDAWRSRQSAALAEAMMALDPEDAEHLRRAIPILGRLAAELGSRRLDPRA
jgi:DNA-binding MarR family transcriptional regulator